VVDFIATRPHIASMSDKAPPQKIASDNRKARFNYSIEDTVEAGIVLTGTEIKSIRTGKATIAESYADAKGDEIWLVNANIPEYLQANRFNHAPKRPRKLLLHKRQINKLIGAIERQGMTLIPLLYFNEVDWGAGPCKGQKSRQARDGKKRTESREVTPVARAPRLPADRVIAACREKRAYPEYTMKHIRRQAARIGVVTRA
jgi:SsrA-binding protein